ncbi:hypothetical protein BJX61DRAFT_532375 [Aspergillus egyptiacus]|nr:hypothetical protein BJX61DRAFT_532375 [Aspergillus egyptiacus]
MTTTLQTSPWVLRKAVLVYAPDFDVSCLARLRIAHNRTANQGSVSLSITADLANLSSRSRVLRLNVPLESVEGCELAQISNNSLCPSHLLPMLQAHVTNVSAVSTLSLRLGTTGVVLCPAGTDSLSPAIPGDLNFHSFAMICQSKFLRLHFSRRQFVNTELDQLEEFSCALRRRCLQTETFDHARHGEVQRDWRAFNLSLDPPPYYQEPVSEQVVGKRRRDPWSISPNNESRKRLLPPSPQLIGSPTEVNTPSTLSPSPASIRPTYFTRASSPRRIERNTLTHLEHELRGLSDDLICELLIRVGRQHLLATPNDVDRDLPSESEKVGLAEIETMERRLQRYVDETVERRLKSHVDEIVESAVSECRDQFFDECKLNEAEFREQVDDVTTDVRITANECMSEMRHQAQQYMNEIEDQGIKVEKSAKDKVAQLMRWFDASTECLLDSTARPSHERSTDARRSSI